MSMIRDPRWVSDRLASGCSVGMIAREAGVSRQTAHTWIARHGLPARTRPRPAAHQLHALYEAQGSVAGVAHELGDLPLATVHRWLAAAGVVLRRRGAPAASGPARRAASPESP